MHHYYVVLGKPLELKLFQTSHPKTPRTDTSVDNIVSFAAIFWDVMQRYPQRNGCSHPTFLSWDKKTAAKETMDNNDDNQNIWLIQQHCCGWGPANKM